MPFVPRHPLKPRNPYAPLWAVPATLGVIAAGYFCVIRPAYKIYRIEKYLSEQESEHDATKTPQPLSSRTNSVLEQRMTNAPEVFK